MGSGTGHPREAPKGRSHRYTGMGISSEVLKALRSLSPVPEWVPYGSGVPREGSYLRGPEDLGLGSQILDIPWMAQRAVATDIRGTGDPGDSSLGHDPGGVKYGVQNGSKWGIWRV